VVPSVKNRTIVLLFFNMGGTLFVVKEQFVGQFVGRIVVARRLRRLASSSQTSQLAPSALRRAIAGIIARRLRHLAKQAGVGSGST